MGGKLNIAINTGDKNAHHISPDAKKDSVAEVHIAGHPADEIPIGGQSDKNKNLRASEQSHAFRAGGWIEGKDANQRQPDRQPTPAVEKVTDSLDHSDTSIGRRPFSSP